MENRISENFLWWQKGVIYQIYPRSFQDSNGDGVGDLKGIIQRLDYLKWLGIDAVWLSPVFTSPMADFGYDISDYTDIHPLFGNMEDFDWLLDEVHRREMKLILDLVPNHSSDQHHWFMESRSSRDNPKRDWYIWKDPKPNGDPPNNWLSVFGGSAWEWDEKTGQYYYHAFLKEQPDLNWRNPEVKKAIFDVMRFWLKKGVDGFRVDVIWHLIKDDAFRDNPNNPDFQEGMVQYDRHLPVFSTDQQEVHDVIGEMRQVIDSFDERLLIGEIYLPVDKLVTYYGKENMGVHLPFNFQLVRTKWDAAHLYALINTYEGKIPAEGWPNWVLSNHDNPRISTRLGEKQARLAAVLLFTLRGTPTLYYGDELGMEDVPIPQDQVQDPQGINEPGKSRDPQRTPMQWSDGDHAGFSTVKPWLPLASDYQDRNVQLEKEKDDSMLMLHYNLIHLRRNHAALNVGKYIPTALEGNLMIFKREHDKEIFAILINFGETEVQISIGEYPPEQIVLSTAEMGTEKNDERGFWFMPAETAVIIQLPKVIQ
jgi:alpha-glucosidase